MAMQARKARTDGVELELGQRLFDPGKNMVLFQSNVVVQHAAQRNQWLGSKIRAKAFPDILYLGAYCRVIRKHAHNLRVLIQAKMTRVPG